MCVSIVHNSYLMCVHSRNAIADELVREGVPKQDIVIAYHAPHVRQYTEFAVG